MKYWKVRIYRPDGHYAHGQITTDHDLQEIDIRQDFYYQLTGGRMLLEGMQQIPYEDVPALPKAFRTLWTETKS